MKNGVKNIHAEAYNGVPTVVDLHLRLMLTYINGKNLLYLIEIKSLKIVFILKIYIFSFFQMVYHSIIDTMCDILCYVDTYFSEKI